MPKKRPPAPPAPAKRLVFLNLTGRLAGLYQITGTDVEARAMLGEGEVMPSYIEDEDGGGSASLIKVTPRFILYRENTPPGGPDVEFHPSQT